MTQHKHECEQCGHEITVDRVAIEEQIGLCAFKIVGFATVTECACYRYDRHECREDAELLHQELAAENAGEHWCGYAEYYQGCRGPDGYYRAAPLTDACSVHEMPTLIPPPSAAVLPVGVRS